MIRVGQNHIYTVYVRYFWQGNHQIYGHMRCIYTVLDNPTHDVLNLCLKQRCGHTQAFMDTCTHTRTHFLSHTHAHIQTQYLTHTHTYARTYTHTLSHNTHTHAHTYTYTYTYAHTHIQTHSHNKYTHVYPHRVMALHPSGSNATPGHKFEHGLKVVGPSPPSSSQGERTVGVLQDGTSCVMKGCVVEWVVGGSKAGCVCDMQVLCIKIGWFVCVVEWVGGRWQQGRLCVRYASSVQ